MSLDAVLALARDYWRESQLQQLSYDRRIDDFFQRCLNENLSFDQARAEFADLQREIVEKVLFGVFLDDFIRRYWATDLEQSQTQARA